MTVPLTRREIEVLLMLTAFPNEQLIYERGTAYFGTQRVAARVVFSLVRSMYIKATDPYPDVEYYSVTERGMEALDDALGVGK